MREKLALLEQQSKALEPSKQTRRELTDAVTGYTDEFLDSITTCPAYIETDDKGAGILNDPIRESGIPIDQIIDIVRHNVDRPGLNPASGGHIAYIPGGGIFHSALGDFMADITNRYAGVFFASPGAVRMENMVLRWMSNLVGYGPEAIGNLTSGGSIANLTGIVTARETQGLKAKDFHRSVIYMTEQIHHSVNKALRIAGLKECIIRLVPMDGFFRLNAQLLEDQIISDRKSGLNPWLVMSSAGTTDTGAVDPLREIGEIANVHKLWHHVDGAYGALFKLCESCSQLLQGLDCSDSMSIDPHKGLFLPYGSGALLVKNGKQLQSALQARANYMRDVENCGSEPSPADVSIELSKPFRALRLWLPLKLLGVAPFRAALEEKILLTRYFYDKLPSLGNFELGPYPNLSVMFFRYLPKRGDTNAFNRKLVEAIRKDGRVFLSSTLINDDVYIRLAVLSFRTHTSTIDLTMKVLTEKIKQIENNGGN